MSYNIKNIRNEFKEKGIFYTQPKLAEYMKSLIDIEITDVYDPTCGDGSLLSCFNKDLPKFGQEINESQLLVAKENLSNFTGVCADTLKSPAFLDKKFSCIIANPPFSISWLPPTGLFKDERFSNVPILPPKSKADYAFLLHIIYMLAENGIAIVLNFPGILYRGNSEGAIRKWFIENNYIDKVIHIPNKQFIDTSIATCVLILRKNKISTDIEFIDNELEISRIVNLQEIVSNDYNLSINTYVQKKENKPLINPIALNSKARLQMLEKLKKDIEFDKMVCSFEGYNFKEYLDSLKQVIESFY